MELRVIVNEVERSISGITETTTCAQIIYALAHATGQKGRFVLVEKINQSERSLAPQERPLEILHSKSDESHQISFILKRLDDVSVTSSSTDPAERLAAAQSISYMNLNVNHHAPPSLEFDEQQPVVNLSRPIDPLFPDSLKTLKNSFSQLSQSSQLSIQSSKSRIRPPPPAYHQVIEQRFSSLTRDVSAAALSQLSGLQSTHNSSDYCRVDSLSTLRPSVSADTLISRLSCTDLEELVSNQKKIIEQQKNHLARLDLSIDDDQQREVLQLERQQENLRAVLNPLRACDWPGQLQRERSELQTVFTAISELKQKLEIITDEIKVRADEESKLLASMNSMIENIGGSENMLNKDDESSLTTS